MNPEKPVIARTWQFNCENRTIAIAVKQAILDIKLKKCFPCQVNTGQTVHDSLRWLKFY